MEVKGEEVESAVVGAHLPRSRSLSEATGWRGWVLAADMVKAFGVPDLMSVRDSKVQ